MDSLQQVEIVQMEHGNVNVRIAIQNGLLFRAELEGQAFLPPHQVWVGLFDATQPLLRRKRGEEGVAELLLYPRQTNPPVQEF